MPIQPNNDKQKLKYLLSKAFDHFKITPKKSIDTITYNYEVETYNRDVRKLLAIEPVNFN